MLFVKHRRILVTCSRRLENPAGLRLSPCLSVFFVSGIVEMQMRGGGRPPGSRTTGLRDLSAIMFRVFFAEKPPPPGSWAAGPGRPAARRLALPPLYKGWLVPHPSFASLKFQKPRKKREGGREAKPCRIFEPATAGNQNFSTLYK